VLIYTDGSLDEHYAHVRTILKKLTEASLYLNIKKYEFDYTETKYLRYIVRAGEGIRIDPEKIRAILEWQPLTIVRGVRGFLGFANFYRKFIRGFS
jgi:Holliday junction resolvasome RuvABC ATP-dependent DNA helicase subunit